MIPKPPSNPDDFRTIVDNMRKQFSSTQTQTIGDIKTAFTTSSHEVVESVDQVRMTNEHGTQKIVDNIVKNAQALQTNLGKRGTHRLVDISYEMLDQGDASAGLLKDIKDLQIGMSSRSGLWGTFRTWIKSFQPFSNEKRQKIMLKQRIAANKLLRLTWLEQGKTTNALKGAFAKSQEEKQEERSFLSKLFGRNKKDEWTKRDARDLSPKGFMGQLKRFIGGLLIASAGGIVAIAMSMLTRFKQFKTAADALDKVVGSMFTKSGLATKIKNIFFTFVDDLAKKFPKIGGLALKNIDPKRFRWIGKIFSGIGKFIDGIMPFLSKLPLFGKAFARIGKFVPFLNIIIGAYELVRGALKGAKKIGGLKGVITGLIGGVFEFFTLGIFDMDAFLETAKSAFTKLENGEFIAGILELFKSPFDGLASGIIWLKDKLLGGDIFDPNNNTGIIGKTFTYLIKPFLMMYDAISWVVKKIMGVFTTIENIWVSLILTIDRIQKFFGTIGDHFKDMIDNPIGTIKKWMLGEKEPENKNKQLTDFTMKNFGQDTTNNRKLAAYMMSEGKSKEQAIQWYIEERKKQNVRDILNTGPFLPEPDPEQIYGPERRLYKERPPAPEPQHTAPLYPTILPTDNGYGFTESTYYNELLINRARR